jgi:peptide/nickel transport system permease protein
MVSRSWPQRIALAWLCIVLLMAVLAPVLPLPYLPNVPDLIQISQPPFQAGRHWLGTDAQGLDVLSQVVFGARTAVIVTFPAALSAAVLGAVAGGAAGFWLNSARIPAPYGLMAAATGWWALTLPWSGLVLTGAVIISAGLWAMALQQHRPILTWRLPLDSSIMGLATTIDTVPRLVVVVAMAATTGVSIPGLVVSLALTSWPYPARLVRAQMLQIRALPFAEAARAVGFSPARVWLRHTLPHAVQPLRAAFPLSLAAMLGLESTLSFLGIGLPPNAASWGRLLAGIRQDQTAWWVAFFPILCLAASILSLHVVSKYQSHRN